MQLARDVRLEMTRLGRDDGRFAPPPRSKEKCAYSSVCFNQDPESLLDHDKVIQVEDGLFVILVLLLSLIADIC